MNAKIVDRDAPEDMSTLAHRTIREAAEAVKRNQALVEDAEGLLKRYAVTPEEGQIYHIIYLSSAVVPLSTVDLQALLKQSRRNNIVAGITGLLLYKDGSFLQVIEGEKSAVEELYARILQDQRHHAVAELFAETVPRREFSNWSMAFRDLSISQMPEGFNELLNSSWSEIDLSAYPKKVKAFMKMFATE